MMSLALLAAPAAVNAAPTVSLTKTPPASGSVPSGQDFNYNFAWSCPGTVTPRDDCANMRIVETLPLELEATALPAPAGSLVKTCVQNSAGDPAPDYATCSQPPVSVGSPTPAGAILHFIFELTVQAGQSGSFQVATRFPGGTTDDGTAVVNTATIRAECSAAGLSADPGCQPSETTATSNPVTATADDRVGIAKAVLGTAGPAGYNTTYRITVRPHPDGDATNWLAPDNVVVTDTLPAGATFVSGNPVPAAGDGSAGNPLTWNLGTLNAASHIDVTVNYPAGPQNEGANASKTNSATVSYEIEEPQSRSTEVTHTLQAANPGVGGSSKTNSDHDNIVNPGQSLSYTVTASNSGNIPLGLRIDDTLPQVCAADSFTIQADATRLTVYDQNDIAFAGFNGIAPTGTNFTAATIGANNSSTFIKRIEVEYGNAGNPIVAVGANRTLVVACTARAADWSGASYLPQTANLVNTATITSANGANTSSVTRTSAVTVRGAGEVPSIAPRAVKTAPGGQTAPGANVTFSIRMENAGGYSSELEQVAMIDPVFADLLPEGMTFVSSARTAGSASCSADPEIHVIADYNSTGRTLVVWDWAGKGCALDRGEFATYNLVATVGDTTLGGERANQVAFLGSANPGDTVSTQFCAATGGFVGNLITGTLNGASGTAGSARCHAGDTTFAVQRVTEVASRKGVKGSLDSGWLYSPDAPDIVGRNVHEQSVFWRLEIDNTANVPLDNIELIDIVPFDAASNPGGTTNSGVGTGAVLGTAWSPRFTAPIDPAAGGAPAGTKVYYTQAPNPCRDTIVAVAGCNPMSTLADGVALSDETVVPAAGQAGQWSTRLPNDPSRVRAFRIVYPTDHVVNPGETLRFEFPMFVPQGAPISDCGAEADDSCSNVAWNTFGFGYREADIDLRNHSAPTRVGVIVQPATVDTASLGDFVWHDTNEDGIQDESEKPNGINDVLVELFRDSDGDGVPDELIASTTTTNDPDTGLPGWYRFSGLEPTGPTDRYLVRFHRPEDMIGSPSNSGGDDADSDGIPENSDHETAAYFDVTDIELAPGEHDPTIDQGFYHNPPRFSLGNRVWYDVNNDGLDNDGSGAEPGSSRGVPGIEVELWQVDGDGNPVGGSPLATQTTNSTGHYLFVGLDEGTYIVVLPAGNFGPGQPLHGLSPSDHVVEGDSDLDANNHGAALADALGVIPANAVVSSLVTLGPLPGDEPVDEIGEKGPEQTPGYYDRNADTRSNLTIDFGFYNEAVLEVEKTAYLGHTGGAGCVAAVDPLVIVDPVAGNDKAVTWCFTLTNGGSLALDNPVFTDSQLGVTPGDQALVVGPVSGSLPLAPGASAIWYVQATHNASMVNDVQVTMTREDEPEPVVSGEDREVVLAYLSDPLLGIKGGTFDQRGFIEWRMVWINKSLIAAEDVVISDAIRAGMTFIDGSLVCEARGSSSYSACDFEAPDPTYPQGRILVAADLGPDFGHSDEAGAENELVVTFRVAVAREASPVNYENEAESSWTPPGEDDPIVDQSTPDPDGDGPSTVEVPPRPTAVPTLSHAGLMLLALLMAMLGRRHLRRD